MTHMLLLKLQLYQSISILYYIEHQVCIEINGAYDRYLT